jgi:hypothetical protein
VVTITLIVSPRYEQSAIKLINSLHAPELHILTVQLGVVHTHRSCTGVEYVQNYTFHNEDPEVHIEWNIGRFPVLERLELDLRGRSGGRLTSISTLLSWFADAIESGICYLMTNSIILRERYARYHMSCNC